MKDWQFWTFIAFIWLAGGILAPFPLDILFFAGAFGMGIAVHFIQRLEQKHDFVLTMLQRLQFEILHEDLEEIKELLGKKREKRDGDKKRSKN